MFTASLFVAGAALIVAASTSALEFAALFVAIMGVCAGSVYVLGFTLLHENVEDELRGRVFSALYTMVRFCVLIAFAVGPFLAALLDRLSENLVGGSITVAGITIAVPGVRLTLWLAGLIIMGAGVLAALSLRVSRDDDITSRVPDPRDERLLQEGAEIVSGLTTPFTEVKRSHQRPEPAPTLASGAPARAGRRRVTGHFIAFEGGEGSGKSTQARRLADRLGSRALFTFEPGDSPLGIEVRRLVLETPDLDITDRAEALLMAADRAQHVVEVIQPALEAGKTVITDRFAGSSIAYQGYGRQLRAEEVERLSRWATDGLWPDLIVLLEVSPQDAEVRLARTKDRVESAGDAFHARVHDGFLVQAMADPDRWAIVDGTASEDDVAAAIWEIVAIRFPDLA